MNCTTAPTSQLQPFRFYSFIFFHSWKAECQAAEEGCAARKHLLKLPTACIHTVHANKHALKKTQVKISVLIGTTAFL